MLGQAVSIAAIASLTAFNLQQGVSQNADVSLSVDTANQVVTVIDNGNADEIAFDNNSGGTTITFDDDNGGDGGGLIQGYRLATVPIQLVL